MKKFSFVVLLVFLLVLELHSQNPQIRYPSINPSGNLITFSNQGDIWVLDMESMQSQRFTIHEAYESAPQFSPDGEQIVFSANRLGNNDLYVMNTELGNPRRLTFHSSSDSYPQWDDKGNIYFSSRRAFAQIERESEVHMISSNGGTPQRALDAVALHPIPSLDGKHIAFVRGTCRFEREAYNGPANRDIWIFNNQSKQYYQITDFEGQDSHPNWGGNSLFFLSARNGRYNIYQQAITEDGRATSEPKAITSFTDEGITYFDVTPDGKAIVFERGDGTYFMKTMDQSSILKIEINLIQDQRFDPIEHKTYTNRATDYSVSPNEKQMAFVVRGELFVKPNDTDKKRAVQLAKHPFRDKEPIWINDSTLIFSSDRDGNFDLYALNSKDAKEKDLYKTFKIDVRKLTTSAEEDERITISPDRTQIAYLRGRGKLVVSKISPTGVLSNERILLDGWATPSGVSWSPDSKWLAYSMDDLDFNEEIYIHKADNSQKPVIVSLHPRGDTNPQWSKDGSKLGFTSTRNNGDRDIWFVWLKKEDWEKTKRDWEEEEPDSDKKSKKGKDKKDDKEVEPVVIDFEDIHERIVQVTRLPGNEGNLRISNDGETFYFTTNGGGRQGSPGDPEFMSVKWDGSELKTLFSELRVSNLQMDESGKALYGIKSGGSFVKLKLSDKKQESLGFTAKMDVNHLEESKQVFQEGWRRLRDGFYDPQFHGQDWAALKAKYYDRTIHATTLQDFQFYFNSMLGQLNASHMGLRGGDNPEETQREQTGRLGIEVVPVSNGVKITHVVPGSAADRTESKLKVGDIITSVNTVRITPNTNFYSLFNGQINERVLLGLSSNGFNKEIIIRPANSIRTELYQEWVKQRKTLTDKYSNGRLGYIHIQGMNWQSFERFERELTASGLGKEGLIIDVRFNGGGWTTDMLMTVLNVKQHAFTIPRGAAKDLEKEKEKFTATYPFGERLPFSSWTRPSIAMCNENSYSNAEIFSHAYKTFGLGTLVGQPTFGAVISTGGAGLLNGAFVRMPFRGWYVSGSDMNMEHGPAVPDIIVENLPDSKIKGEDPQLKKSVEVLLEQIGTPDQ